MASIEFCDSCRVPVPEEATRARACALASKRSAVLFAAWLALAVTTEGQCGGDEKQKLIPGNAPSSSRFGWSLARHDDLLVVGAPEGTEDAAYTFRHDGFNWSEEQKLTASDSLQDDLFGWSSATDGTVIVVGAPGPFWPAGTGSAYVFRFDGSQWVEEQKLTASDSEAGDRFGDSVAVHGDLVIVGATEDASPGTHSGSAYVYRFDGVLWNEEQKLTASNGLAHDLFGGSVAAREQTIVVGAWGGRGQAYVFRPSSGRWAESQRLTSDKDGDQFGVAVAIDTNSLVVGARRGDGSTPGSGTAYLFEFDGSQWSREQKFAATDGATNDHFGQSVAVHGSSVLVGASEARSVYGSAYLYRHDGSHWAEQRVVPSDGASYDMFGRAVAVHDTELVVGAYGHDASGSDSGAAYVFCPGPVVDSVDRTRTRYDQSIGLTIRGSGFSFGSGTSVWFDTWRASNVVVVDDTTITCDTPLADPGQVNVDLLVRNSEGEHILVDAFTFTPALYLNGNPTTGGDVKIRYLVDPGDSLFAILGLPPERSLDTPPYDGQLCILPFHLLLYIPTWPFAEFEISFDIPDDPVLSGVDVLFQALAGPSLSPPKNAAWTNCGVLGIE